jgi:type II secretory pathway component PulJ
MKTLQQSAIRLVAARRRGLAFTIIEMMLAIGIFMMILISIYSIWSGIVKASLAARKAADRAQRARVAMHAIESALVTAQMFTANQTPKGAYYSFEADAENGDYGRLSFVAHLPADFPGVGRYGDHLVRRVTFTCQSEKDGTVNLVMSQSPMLEAMNPDNVPYTLVLAKEVQLFGFEMWGQPDPIKNPRAEKEWLTKWESTNSLPEMMRIGLGLGKTDNRDKMQDLVVKIIALPAKPVPGTFQMQGGK